MFRRKKTTAQVSAVPHGHVPVMLTRVTELLAPAIDKAGGTAAVIDCTLGAGGHSEHLLTMFPNLCVIGLDRDAASLKEAQARLAPFGDRFTGIHTTFDHLISAVEGNIGIGPKYVRERGAAGVLFDLGVSSMQLDQDERGFSYSRSAPLDMRMDQSTGMTAADVLNTYSHGDLARILKTYGDERFAGKIASAIVAERDVQPFQTSDQLVELIYKVVPAPARRTGGHPAKRTFQALRVEVNHELEGLKDALPQALEILRPGGRLVVMSYQSLEDKITKELFRKETTSATPPGLPIELPGMAADFTLVTRGAEKADDKEADNNPRAQSVRVRAIEKLAGEAR